MLYNKEQSYAINGAAMHVYNVLGQMCIRDRDYVIATGVQHSVREFAQLAFHYVGIELQWAVSYTHLDVYKRQGLTLQQSHYDEAIAWNDEVPEQKYKKMMRTPNTYGYFTATFTPVSYTHLPAGALLWPADGWTAHPDHRDRKLPWLSPGSRCQPDDARV